MSKVKQMGVDINDINKMIKSLKQLSSNLDKLNKDIPLEIASIGQSYLNNQYTNVSDPNITDINTGITQKINGANILSFGRDVLYEEFGTGDEGQQSPHPDKAKYNLNDYNSGSFILDVSDVKNQEMLDILAANGITSGKFWSYRKGGQSHLTQGVPAGMEMYKTSKHLKDEVIKDLLKEKASDVLSKV